MPVDLLLLHGALGARTQVAALADALGSTFRVHTIDFEGHGDAPPRDRPFRIEHFAENVLEHLDGERIARAHIFGYSMGGYVACYLALTHPQRVARIVTLGTKWRWDPETALRESARLDPATIRAKVPKLADAWMARHENAGGWESVLARTADFLQALGRNPLLTDDTLARIASPVRVIVGHRDNTVTVEESARVARLLPAGELIVMAETPHPIEQVDVPKLASLSLRFFVDSAV